MAEDSGKDAPSLEPPSLFRRKKKSEPPAPDQPAADQPDQPAPEAPEAPVEAPLASQVEEEVPVADDGPTTIFDDTSEPTPDVEPEPEPPREPWLGGAPAAVLTGLFTGALIVAATAGSLHVCTAVKGTSSCGGPGFFLLVAILVVAVLIGAGMLRSAHVPEPGSTSFLAVGLLSVVALLFLVGSIFQWWMVIVIPLASVATYLLSYWVTTSFIDPANDGSDQDREPEPHDIR